MSNSKQYHEYLKEIDSDVRGALKIIRVWDDAVADNFGIRFSTEEVKSLVAGFIQSEKYADEYAEDDIKDTVERNICFDVVPHMNDDQRARYQEVFKGSQWWHIEDRKTRVATLMAELSQVIQEILCEQ